MKGNPEIITVLSDVLSAELTAINQYFIHAKLFSNWGYKKLGDYTRKESIDEMKHAEVIMERILFLDGIPDMQKYMKINAGKNVKEAFEFDLKLEYSAVERLNLGIETAVRNKDNGSRELLEKILVSEEEHIDWLETQLHLIEEIGISQYLAEQIGE